MSKGVRKRIADDVEKQYETIKGNLIAAASGATKTVWVTCSHCHKRTEASVPDIANSVKAAQLLLDQGFGRPAPDTGESERRFKASSLAELTDDQLEAIINGELTVEGMSA